MRIGHGFDVHKFGGEGPLVIGGVRIPYEKVCWPTRTVTWLCMRRPMLCWGRRRLGISANCSRIPIRLSKAPTAVNCCVKPGNAFAPKATAWGNLDITIIAQAPKMAPHIPQMRVFLAEDLQCHMDDVNVKATTTEQLGFTGRGGRA